MNFKVCLHISNYRNQKVRLIGRNVYGWGGCFFDNCFVSAALFQSTIQLSVLVFLFGIVKRNWTKPIRTIFFRLFVQCSFVLDFLLFERWNTEQYNAMMIIKINKFNKRNHTQYVLFVKINWRRIKNDPKGRARTIFFSSIWLD